MPTYSVVVEVYLLIHILISVRFVIEALYIGEVTEISMCGENDRTVTMLGVANS